MGCFIIGLFKIICFGGLGYWLYDDSKSRDRNPFFWIVALVLLWLMLLGRGFWFSIFWLIIYTAVYFFIRPKGELIYCVECFKKKIETLKYCPWCFHIDEDAFEDDDDVDKKDSTENQVDNKIEPKQVTDDTSEPENQDVNKKDEQNTKPENPGA